MYLVTCKARKQSKLCRPQRCTGHTGQAFGFPFAPQPTCRAQPITYAVGGPYLLPRGPLSRLARGCCRHLLCRFCFRGTTCNSLLQVVAQRGVQCMLREPWKQQNAKASDFEGRRGARDQVSSGERSKEELSVA